MTRQPNCGMTRGCGSRLSLHSSAGTLFSQLLRSLSARISAYCICPCAAAANKKHNTRLPLFLCKLLLGITDHSIHQALVKWLLITLCTRSGPIGERRLATVLYPRPDAPAGNLIDMHDSKAQIYVCTRPGPIAKASWLPCSTHGPTPPQ
eukprot:10610149-Karenia_brevis.AAC.1